MGPAMKFARRMTVPASLATGKTEMRKVYSSAASMWSMQAEEECSDFG